MLTRNGKMALALTLAGALAAGPLQAQRGPGSRGEGGPNLGRSPEVALEHQEDLGLSGDQVAQLTEMKTVIDQNLKPLSEEIKALREGVRAGELDREEGLRQMQELQGRFLTASAPLRGRVQGILTVEQHRKLQPLVRQGRPGVGREGTVQGQGRGRAGMRGQMRGSRGGVGLRQGFYGQGRAPALGFRGGPPRVQLLRPGRGAGPIRGGRRIGAAEPSEAPGVLPAAGF